MPSCIDEKYSHLKLSRIYLRTRLVFILIGLWYVGRHEDFIICLFWARGRVYLYFQPYSIFVCNLKEKNVLYKKNIKSLLNVVDGLLETGF